MVCSSAMSANLKMIGIKIRLNESAAVYSKAIIEALASLARRLLPVRATATKHPPISR